MIICHFHFSLHINSIHMYKCTFIVSTYFLIGWWWCSSFWIRDIPQLACCPCPTWQLAVVRLTATTHNSIFHPRPQSPAPLSSGSGSDKRSEEWSDVRWGERVTHPAPGSGDLILTGSPTLALGSGKTDLTFLPYTLILDPRPLFKRGKKVSLG